MKKLLLSVVLIASALTFTFAQKDYSKWSVTPKAGLTYYRVTPQGDGFVNDASWGFGVSVERTYNPLFGIGLDLSYGSFNRNTVAGGVFDPILFGSANLSNLLLPHRAESPKINLYAKAGVGVAYFHNDFPNALSDGSGFNPTFMGSIHPEYNLNKSFAVGFEVTARYYSREIMGGQASKDRFDDGMTAMATLRYNFNGENHLRHATLDEFYPAIPPKSFVEEVQNTIVNNVESKYDDTKLVNRLDNLDRQNQNIQNRLAKLENDLRNLKEQAKGAVINASFQNIEFDFDSANLTDASYVVLNKIVSILKDVPTWATLQVNGYTDNIGSEKYNLKLSDARAKAVKDYLVARGISESVVSAKGYGEASPIANNSTRSGREKNRRVEFQIVK